MKSKREQNKQNNRNRLMEVGIELFSTKGIDQTTVADIVKEAELGRGTFYNYFEDVKTLFDHVIDDMYTELRGIIKEARENATNIYSMLYASFLSYFNYVTQAKYKDFHQLNQAYLRSASYENKSIRSLIMDLRQDLSALKEFGEFEKAFEVQLLSIILVGTPVELILNRHKINADFSNNELADFLAKLFTKAIKPAASLVR